MKLRTSTMVMLGVWFATFVLYVMVRPDSSTGLPLKMIPLLTQTEQSPPTTTAPPSSTTPKPSTTTPVSPPPESTSTSSTPTE